MITRILPLPLLLFALVTFAADSSRPANFDHEESDRRLANLIKFPEEVSGKVSLVLNCVSRIKPSGKMDDTGCYTENQYEQAFTGMVIKAAKKARMTPAIFEGKPVEIYLQFRVQFVAEEKQQKEKQEEEENEKEPQQEQEKEKEKEEKEEKRELTVRLYMNPGYEENVLEYGFDHIAGQRVIGKNEPWMDACPKHARYSLWVRAYLGEDGRAESPTIEFGNGLRPISSCLDSIKQTIIDGRYTPAIADGIAVPSTYIEIFSN